MLFSRRPLTPIEEALGYRFKDLSLLETALTHRSLANEKGLAVNYERLEFLGDAVLGVMVAESLFLEHPEMPEGELSKRKSALVSEKALVHHARVLGVGEALRLGVGEERSGGRRKPSLLADVVEAVFGALWLDGGPDVARQAVRKFLAGSSSAGTSWIQDGDAKTRLQEVVQGWGWDRPEYRLVAAEGPDHKKRFVVECALRGEVAGEGAGSSKKEAEQRAAAAALARLEGEGRHGGVQPLMTWVTVRPQ
ncbi:MAG TPA: ribonuclease III [Thermoanaerobaculia bacterium]|nr:ribonuclease III [Thermoanaerobaculia bacterium]